MLRVLKIIAMILGFFSGGIALAAAAGLTIPQGGTGQSNFVQGTIPIGPGRGALHFATSSNLIFSTSTNILTTNSITLSGLTGVIQCLHVNSSGLISGTGVDCGSSSGGVTSLTAGLGLNGGTITTTGTISLKNFLATSTSETKGQLPYWTSTNGTPATLGKVSTTSLSAGSGITFVGTPGALVGGTNLTINGVPFSFTPHPWGNSTSTTIGFVNGLISNASSTFTNALLIANGSVSVPSIAFSSNTNTGLYKAGTNSLGFAGGGSGFQWNGSALTPNTTNAKDLGSTANAWRHLFAQMASTTGRVTFDTNSGWLFNGFGTTSPNENLVVDNTANGNFSTFEAANHNVTGIFDADSVDSFNGQTGIVAVGSKTNHVLGLLQDNHVACGIYDDNTLDTLFDCYPPANGDEMTFTNSLPQTAGTVFWDRTLMNYGANTGLNASDNFSKTTTAQAFPTFSDVWWDQSLGSNAAKSYAFFVASTTENGVLGTTTAIALGDVATSSYSSTNGVKLNGPTLQLVSNHNRYEALGVFKDSIATSSQLLGIYNDGHASTSNLTISNLLTLGSTTPIGGIGAGLTITGNILRNSGVRSLANGTGIACSSNPSSGSGSCSFANQSANTVLVNQKNANGIPIGLATSTFATTLYNSVAPTFGTITGSIQCIHVNASGVVSGTGADCGSGSGAVSSVSNSDGTLTISPTTGTVIASLALGHANTWTAKQTINFASTTAITASGEAVIPNSVAPTISNTGEVAINTTAASSSFEYFDGTTRQALTPDHTASIAISSTTALQQNGHYVIGTTKIDIGSGTASTTELTCGTAPAWATESTTFVMGNNLSVEFFSTGTTTVHFTSVYRPLTILKLRCLTDNAATPSWIQITADVQQNAG